MGTSAPVRREHSIPIVEPPQEPRRLPAPDPERWVTPGVPVPEYVPEKVEVPR